VDPPIAVSEPAVTDDPAAVPVPETVAPVPADSSVDTTIG
jgi:hypothetical protein